MFTYGKFGVNQALLFRMHFPPEGPINHAIYHAGKCRIFLLSFAWSDK